LGAGKARNLGAQKATTELLAFTDSDCVLPKNWLSKIIKNFKNPNIQFVCGSYSGSAGNSFLEKYAFYELLVRRKHRPKFVTSFPSNNFACYRKIFLKEKGFPEFKNYVAEDLEFSLTMAKKYKIIWDKDLGIKHHFHNKTKKYLKQQYNFARDTMFLYLRKPYLKKIKTYQEDKNKFVIFYTGLAGLNIVGVFFYPPSIYFLPFLILILILFDFNLINYVHKKEGLLSSTKSLGLILLRDISWVLGMLKGLVRFFV
jgi:cellulose synthase/poly-beta-1,6-N-acetylglucosamine synthase-like glycosyltransferase